MGYDVVGEIDQLGDGVSGFQLGDRVADMTVVGSNATYRTLRASDLTRVPAGVDTAEAAALILSWTTAYQLLHRTANVQQGQRVLVQGAAGAVGQALLMLGRMAGLELWGTAHGEHAALIREIGASPIDYKREDFARVLPDGFDVVFDGVGEDDYRRSFAALKPGGLLCAYGYTASVQAQRGLLSIVSLIVRQYLWRQLLSWLPGGKRLRVYSINLMRAQHPAWFKEDLERLFVTQRRHPTWRQLVSVDLGNGAPPFHLDSDKVGVATSWEFPKALTGIGDVELLAAQKAVDGGKWRESPQANAWVGYPIARVLELNAEDEGDKAKIRRMLKAWIYEGKFLVVKRHDDKTRKEVKFVEVGKWVTDVVPAQEASVPPVADLPNDQATPPINNSGLQNTTTDVAPPS
jgi:NADPH:quinone reductase-like Zn-dependent oxidoreductase